MFNLFKPRFPKETEPFASAFSKDQKAAILGALIITSNIDGSPHIEEDKYLEKCGLILHMSFNDSAISRSANSGLDFMVKQLKSLTIPQKEWFAVALFELMMSKGSPRGSQATYVLNMLNDIGIDKNAYSAILKKRAAIARQFNIS